MTQTCPSLLLPADRGPGLSGVALAGPTFTRSESPLLCKADERRIRLSPENQPTVIYSFSLLSQRG